MPADTVENNGNKITFKLEDIFSELSDVQLTGNSYNPDHLAVDKLDLALLPPRLPLQPSLLPPRHQRP